MRGWRRLLRSGRAISFEEIQHPGSRQACGLQQEEQGDDGEHERKHADGDRLEDVVCCGATVVRIVVRRSQVTTEAVSRENLKGHRRQPAPLAHGVPHHRVAPTGGSWCHDGDAEGSWSIMCCVIV
jgi:hypothetical protein